jgi:hypothetical protein
MELVLSTHCREPTSSILSAPEGRNTMNAARLYERALGMREGQVAPSPRMPELYR